MYTVNFNPSPQPQQACITSFLHSCIHTSWFVNYSSSFTSSLSIILGLSYTFKITKLINYLKKISKMYGYLEKTTCRTAYVVCRHLSRNRRKETHTHTHTHIFSWWTYKLSLADTQRSNNNWFLSLGGRLFGGHTFHTWGLCDGITWAKNKYSFSLKEAKVMVGELNTTEIL